MKKKVILILLITAITLLLIVNMAFRNSKDKELIVENYLPNATMVKYFNGGHKNGGLTHSVEILNKNEVNIVEEGTGAEDTEYKVLRKYKASDNEIRYVSYRLRKPYESGTHDTNYNILQGPLEVGTKWSYDSFDLYGRRSYEITGVNKRLYTRMGIFYTIEVKTTGWNYEVKEYYAKNIGLVKRITKNTDSQDGNKVTERTFSITKIR